VHEFFKIIGLGLENIEIIIEDLDINTLLDIASTSENWVVDCLKYIDSVRHTEDFVFEGFNNEKEMLGFWNNFDDPFGNK
jgi:hypothetical protein